MKLDIVGIIVGVVGAVLAYIFHLRASNKGLKDKVGMLEGNQAIRDLVTKKDEAEQDAKLKEDKYTAARNAFLKSLRTGEPDEK